MLKELLSLTAGAVVLATSAAAYPFTLTNRDGRRHKLTISYDRYDEEEFKGHEIVAIFEGRLVVAE